MKRFAALCAELDEAPGDQARLLALRRYLLAVDAADAAWAVYLLAGGRPPKALPRGVLQAAARQATGLPDWLFALSVKTVGDMGEAIAHLLPPARHAGDSGLAHSLLQRWPALLAMASGPQRTALIDWWDELNSAERMVLCKLLGGAWRGGKSWGLSPVLLQAALADHAAVPPALMARRLLGFISGGRAPDSLALAALLAPTQDQSGMPCSFAPAPLLPSGLDTAQALQQQLGPVSDWLLTWAYDGQAAQLVRSAGQVWLWASEQELLSAHLPELQASAPALPEGMVLSGCLLVWPTGQALPSPRSWLQRRLGRQRASKPLLAQAPVRFVVDDLLALPGQVQCTLTAQQRRDWLQAWLGDADHGSNRLQLAPELTVSSWSELLHQRSQGRVLGARGLLLAHRMSLLPLSERGVALTAPPARFWWPNETLRARLLLLYARPAGGRSGAAITELGFALWSRRPQDEAEAQAVVDAIARREPPLPDALQLLAFGQASTDPLTQGEQSDLSELVRNTTVARFGPMRSLRPTMLVNVEFEAIESSNRHQAGLKMIRPRIVGLCAGTPLVGGGTLASMRRMMHP